MDNTRLSSIRRIIIALAFIILASPLLAQVTTGSISGTVKDQQGGVIPGATVVLISEAQRTRLTPVITSNTGNFLYAGIKPDSYTLEVTMSSFKTLLHNGITVSPGERVALGALVLELGGSTETVSVTGESVRIQSESAERSYTIEKDSLENLPSATRNFISMISLTPGVSGEDAFAVGRLGSTTSNNVQMDGVSTMDTGSNRAVVALNIESIEEVKVMTSNYQAEFGQYSGLQITTVTKSGTNAFHGSVYDVEHHSQWYANSKTNKLNGNSRPLEHNREWGYSIGGPIGKPNGKNKLFFFHSLEFEPRTTGLTSVAYRLPTDLERKGDFSQSTDNNGNLYPYIKDPLLTGSCSATNQAACFKDGGVLGRIPQGRLYQLGLNILKMYPSPNLTSAPGQAYNFQMERPTESSLSYQPVVRMDYQMTPSLHGSFKYAGYRQPDQTFIGYLPGWDDRHFHSSKVTMETASVNWVINAKTFLDGTFGRTYSGTGGCAGFGGAGQGVPQFCRDGFPTTAAGNMKSLGIGDFPLLLPNAVVIDPQYNARAYDLLTASSTTAFEGNRVVAPPVFSWGSRIGTVATVTNPTAIAPPGYNFGTTMSNSPDNLIYQASVNVVRVEGTHTLKAGFYFNRTSKRSVVPSDVTGSVNFGNDSNNPLDTGFGFSNAALGIFSSYTQANLNESDAFFSNIEGYLQDTWKINSRLTLDYGLRLINARTEHDKYNRGTNFFPDKWNASAAPVLYVAGCANGQNPCSGSNRQAKNPITGQFLGPNSSIAIGTKVPGTGDGTNGLVLLGKGIANAGFNFPKLLFSPRVGVAWDVTGKHSFVLRAGAGLMYDRPAVAGISTGSNPPTLTRSTVNYGKLGDLSSGTGLTINSPVSLGMIQYERDIPSSAQWSVGIQKTFPFSTMLDVAYQGEHAFNLAQNVNINAVDFGTAFGQVDPTLATPTPVDSNLMRSFKGYSSITRVGSDGWRTYHSIQLSFNRRFSKGVSFGFNDTIALYDHSNSAGLGGGRSSITNNGPVRIQHNTDGTFLLRADQAQQQELLGDNRPPRHTFKANFIWDLPDFRSTGLGMKAVGLLLNDWQISGIWTASSGSAYSVGYSYASSGANVNLTGSPDYAARVRIVGNPNSGCSGDSLRQFDASAFAGPLPGSVGLESGSNYLRGCFQSRVDLSLARHIRIWEHSSLQLRVDVTNAPNNSAITAVNSTINLSSPSTPTAATNLPFDANGNIIAARSIPRGAGFGVASGYQNPRTILAQIRFSF